MNRRVEHRLMYFVNLSVVLGRKSNPTQKLIIEGASNPFNYPAIPLTAKLALWREYPCGIQMGEEIRIAWLECSASELLSEMEAALIQHFKPFLNWTKVEGWARPRVTVYFSEEIYKYLVERADRELRTVANLVEYLVVQSVQQQQSEEQKPQYEAKE